MELKDLKEGDVIIHFQYEDSIYKAKVLANFPDKEKIYVKINEGLWGLIYTKVLKDYGDYNFDLIRK